MMAQMLIRDLTSETVEQLKRRAKHNNRSLEAEVRVILEDIATSDARREELIAFADQSRKLNGPQQTDSVELIRQDRKR
jgi:plasmid stability protein